MRPPLLGTPKLNEGARKVNRRFQQHPAGQVQPPVGTQKRGSWPVGGGWRKCNMEGTALKESKVRAGEKAEKVSRGNGGKS